MLWVYGHYKSFNSFSVGTVFRRQNLTYKNSPRAEKVGRFTPTMFTANHVYVDDIL